jgi:hypothetical protein
MIVLTEARTATNRMQKSRILWQNQKAEDKSFFAAQFRCETTPDKAILAHEHIEIPRDQAQQPPARNLGPSLVARGPHFLALNVARQPAVRALVETEPQAAVSTRRSFACCGKSTTCARVIDGNPSRRSSIGSPAFR